MTTFATRPTTMPVRYRIETRQLLGGGTRCAVYGTSCTCPEPGCWHEELFPWRWATEADAQCWIDGVIKRHAEAAALADTQSRHPTQPTIKPPTRRLTNHANDPTRAQTRRQPPPPRARR